MNIAVIKYRMVASGGAERYASGLVNAMLDDGHEVRVLAHRWDPALERKGLKFHRVPAMDGLSFARELSFALACPRAVRRLSCDFVLSIDRALHQDIHRAGGGAHREWLDQWRRFASPLKRASFRVNPLHWTLLWIERRCFSPANTRFVVAISRQGKAEIIRHYGFPADRIRVVHPAVDADRFRPTPRPASPDRFVVLLVGFGFERKGLDFAIRALALLPGHVHLHVAGEGRREPSLNLALSLGVSSRLVFLGRTSQMERVYADSDLLVRPALYEPFGIAALEGLACGLPLVVSRANGVSDVICSGRNGRVVDDPADARSLAAAITEFLNPGRWQDASAEARRTAEGLTYRKNVEEILALARHVPGHPGHGFHPAI